MPDWYVEHHDDKVDRTLLCKAKLNGVLPRLAVGSSEGQVLVSVELKAPNFLRSKAKPLEDTVKSTKDGRQVVRLLSCLFFDQLAPNRCHLLPFC